MIAVEYFGNPQTRCACKGVVEAQEQGHTLDLALDADEDHLAALIVQQGGVLGADPAVSARRALKLLLLLLGEVRLL